MWRVRRVLRHGPIVTLGSSESAPSSGSESTLTVLIAFGANFLVAVAKSWAAALTGSASMVAEAAHSWADTGWRDSRACSPCGRPAERLERCVGT